MLCNVAVVVVNGFLPFEFGTICEVFGVDRADDGLPSYDFAVVAGEPAPLRAHNDFTIQPSCGLERLEEAELIALPAVDDDRLSIYSRRDPPLRRPAGPDAPREFPEDLLLALRRAVDRGARVLSVCSGAFILGEAGLLDGRRCTTHWRNAQELARRYPSAKVDPDVLYVDDDPVITSAGTAAGIDACLYLVRKEQGSRVANGIARRMVVPPHRDGGQAQYVDQPVAPSCDGTLRDLLEWLRAHLDQPLTVRLLAARANMSEPTFAPPFRARHRHHAAAVAYRAAHPAGPAGRCSKRATIRWTLSPTGAASATRPPCATTSAPGAVPLPTPTAASSAGIPGFFPALTPLRPCGEHPSDPALTPVRPCVEHLSDPALTPSDPALNTLRLE